MHRMQVPMLLLVAMLIIMLMFMRLPRLFGRVVYLRNSLGLGLELCSGSAFRVRMRHALFRRRMPISMCSSSLRRMRMLFLILRLSISICISVITFCSFIPIIFFFFAIQRSFPQLFKLPPARFTITSSIF